MWRVHGKIFFKISTSLSGLDGTALSYDSKRE